MHQEIPVARITPSPTNPRKSFDEEKIKDLAESIKEKGVIQPIIVRPLKVAERMISTEPLTAIKGITETTRQMLEHVKTAGQLIDLAKQKLGKENLTPYGQVLTFVLKQGVLSNQASIVASAVMGEPPRYELVAGERRFRAAKLAGLVEIPATVRHLSDVEVLEIQAIENDQREDVLPSERARGYQALIEAGRTMFEIGAKIGKSESWVRNVLRIGNLPSEAAEALDGGEM